MGGTTGDVNETPIHASRIRILEQARGVRLVPERGEIAPGEIRLALGDTFMLGADFVDRLRFCLAGTRVCALFCREIKGEVFSEVLGEPSPKPVEELLAIVNEEAAGIVAGITARTEEGHDAELEMLLLPLAYSGHARIRVLGVLAPAVPPYWLGGSPVTSLDLVTLRHIGPEIKSRAAPRFGRLADGSRLRRLRGLQRRTRNSVRRRHRLTPR